MKQPVIIYTNNKLCFLKTKKVEIKVCVCVCVWVVFILRETLIRPVSVTTFVRLNMAMYCLHVYNSLTVIIVFRLLYCKFNDSDALFKNSTIFWQSLCLFISTVAVLGAGLMGAGIAQVSKESFYEFKSKLRLKGLLQSLALVSMWWAFLINFFVSIKCGLLKILGENISVNILMGWGP